VRPVFVLDIHHPMAIRPQPHRSTTPRPAPRHSEDREQKALLQWAASKTVANPPDASATKLADYLFAIPNGGLRSKSEAARLKSLGVKAGVSDLFLPLPRCGSPGLWIEMKKPIGEFPTATAAQRSVSDAQATWRALMRLCGYAAEVCYGWDAARSVIERYLATGSTDEARLKMM
jgi:hypothetical protein